ncbi:MAG: hypothetical protein NXI00_05285 [Cytophagales bacterium]|nr:hypothetical protein [Cytophagales bacterium]
MPRNLFIIGLSLLFISCQSGATSENDSTKESTEKQTLVLDTFNIYEFPAAIDGCACYFSEKGITEAFIFVDDFAQTAFIKVNGSFEQLEIYDALSKDGVIKQKCRSEHYGIDINLKELGHEDETWQYEGTMKFTKIDGSVLNIEVSGECGC